LRHFIAELHADRLFTLMLRRGLRLYH
jgi:hypothetical protein